MELDKTQDESASPFKSHIKLIKNSKNVNWEIKLVLGDEAEYDTLKDKALKLHQDLIKEFEDTINI